MFTVAVSVTYACTAQNLEEYIVTHELTSSLTNAGINSINVQEHCLPTFTFLLALMRNQFAGMQSSISHLKGSVFCPYRIYLKPLKVPLMRS